MSRNKINSIGKILKQQRILLSLTLQELAAKSSVSSSHLGRIEGGQRFPSAHILFKIAEPLGFKESELFTLAGYLSQRSSNDDKSDVNSYQDKRLDPYVAKVLAEETVEVQRVVLGILSILKSFAKSIREE